MQKRGKQIAGSGKLAEWEGKTGAQGIAPMQTSWNETYKKH
jgi:hypothetical protein